jgi:iron complex outermembrane recepter protein
VHSGESESGSNTDAGDLGRLHKAGFRFEKEIDSNDNITLQGDVFNGNSGGADQTFPILSARLTPVLTPPYAKDYSTTQEYKGYSLLGRWEHKQSADSNTSLQVYWDSHQRDLVSFNTVNRVDTFDVDFQHNFKLTEQQRMVWGLGYRHNMNDTSNGNIIVFDQPKRSDDLYSLFVQDDITLQPERWKLTLGSRFEHNPSTGIEVQPSARLLWTPNEQQSLWASISRAVRTPSWADEDIALGVQTIPPVGGGAASPFNPAVMIGIVGDKKIVSEKLMAYEAGWRGVVKHGMTADVALYYYDYDDLGTTNPNALDFTNIGSGYLLQTAIFASGAKAKNYGGEIGLDWQVLDSWKLRASYAHFESNYNLKSNLPAGSDVTFKNSYPRHQATLWSQHQVNSNVNLDLNLRYVDEIGETAPISSYTAFDARVAWNPSRNLELALVGRNLLNGKHAEFGKQFFFSSSEMPRELFVTARYHF